MTDVKRERAITNKLLDLGLDAGGRGFIYVRSAVRLAAECLEKKEFPTYTDGIYPNVAKEFSTTSSRVERAIRHSIEKAFIETNPENLYMIFRNSINPNTGKVDNSTFINRVADEILLIEAEERIS